VGAFASVEAGTGQSNKYFSTYLATPLALALRTTRG